MSARYLITGGAGFIGTNVAVRLCEDGARVRVLDDLSGPGSERNADWLLRQYGGRVELLRGSVRDRAAVEQAVEGVEAVIHLAAQAAVTASLLDPISDFQVNALGTLHLLEAVRARESRPALLFTSTHKVYGALDDVALSVNGRRYRPNDLHLRMHGVSERRPLDFHGPHGCSKGAADQYVLDYARTYHLPAAVLRAGCIYGPHQCGDEDQGWVAHYLTRAMEGEPITLRDGRQVRDLLYVDDLVDALLAALGRMDRVAGKAFNVGGGPTNTVSPLELLALIESGSIHGRRPEVRMDAWRPADQRWYVSDTQRFRDATGWAPRYGVPTGVLRLHRWLSEDFAARQPRAVVAEGTR
ncbi:MAG TPA: NAD-dependent epimerase/dehydratase family protein [Myxococcales bacterium]|jgi:CDP-paratose 2-epimerase|nr:NAD-dependent epimerase/dehydratase family protein [Myxococcales bacterium]